MKAAQSKVVVPTNATPQSFGSRLPHAPKKHVRMVYEDAGKCFYELEDFGEMLQCLDDLVTALSYMMLADYIHRNVNPTNAFFLQGQGKITGLTDAIRYGAVSPYDPEFDTLDFIAVEYQADARLFGKSSRDSSEDSPPTDWFCHHFVHDLESVYWQYLWYIFHRIPSCITLSEADRARIVQTRAEYFGDDSDPTQTRQALLTDQDGWRTVEDCFRGLYDTHGLSALLQPVQLARRLRAEYTRINNVRPEKVCDEKDVWTGHWRYPRETFTEAFHREFQSDLRKAMESLGGRSCLTSPVE